MNELANRIRVETLGDKVLLGVHTKDRLDGVILTLTHEQSLELSRILAKAASGSLPRVADPVGWVEQP